MAGVSNTQISNQLDELEQKLNQFISQYDQDMRGDAQLNGGKKGVINTIREIKQCQEDYPSLTWMLSHRTAKTITTLVIVYAILMTLWSAGLFSIISGLVGVNVPIP
jgi:hypothetical protein